MENKQKILQSVRNYSKTLKIISIVLEILLGLFFCFYIYVAVSVLGSSNSAFSPLIYDVINNVDYSRASPIIQHVLSTSGTKGLVTFMMIITFIGAVMMFVILLSCTKIFGTIDRTGVPFDRNLIKPLRLIFIIMVIMTIELPIAAAILALFGLFVVKFYEYGCCLQQDEGQMYIVLDSNEE